MLYGKNSQRSKMTAIVTTFILIASLSISAAALSSPAQAAPSKPITISLSAKVTSVSDPANLLNGAVQVGHTITGKYVYNVLTKDTNPDITVGDYQHNNEAYGITLNAGNLIFKTDPNNVNFLVELVNRELQDNYLLRSYNNLPLSNGLLVNHIAWQLDDDTGNALSTASLKKTPTPPILADWQDPFGLTIEGSDQDDSNEYFIRAHVESVSLIGK
jgi:hypothetical protein